VKNRSPFSAMEIAPKSFNRYPLGGRHWRPPEQPVSASGPTGWVAMSFEILYGPFQPLDSLQSADAGQATTSCCPMPRPSTLVLLNET
jgi:hypothetical protein